jgi:hypothetical protein
MAFATAAELASYLQMSVDTASAELVLDLASGAIRAATGQTIDRVTNNAAKVRAPRGYELVLPQRPADAPTLVKVGGVAVTDYSVDTDTAGRTVLWRASGWLANDLITGAPMRVEVTYSHGYATIPSEVKRVCLQAAGRGYRNPEGLRSETIGAESYTYATETNAAVDLTPRKPPQSSSRSVFPSSESHAPSDVRRHDHPPARRHRTGPPRRRLHRLDHARRR